MNQYIAVASDSVLLGLKRYLILFDKVAVVQSSDSDWRFRAEDPSLAADLDWLEDRGLVFRVQEFLHRECGFEFEIREKAERGKRVIVKIEEVRQTYLGREFIEKFKGKTVKDIMSGVDDLACRWEARRLATSMAVQTVSLSSPRPEVSELLGVEARS